jgi:hypothetical protein
VRIGSEGEFLQIDLLEVSTVQRRRDMRVGVTIGSHGFRGHMEDVWIDDLALTQFLGHFNALIESLQGTAVLESMSPDEFHLEIAPLDSRGHFQIAASLNRRAIQGRANRNDKVSAMLEFDQAELGPILGAFKSLLSSSE